MADDDLGVTEKLKELPRWPMVFHKDISNGGVWTSICTMPSDVHHWRLCAINADGTAGAPVRISYEDEPPPNSSWFPLFGGIEQFWRYNAPKRLYGQPFTGGVHTIVMVEVWCTKMPALVKDRQKSLLTKPGRRQV